MDHLYKLAYFPVPGDYLLEETFYNQENLVIISALLLQTPDSNDSKTYKEILDNDDNFPLLVCGYDYEYIAQNSELKYLLSTDSQKRLHNYRATHAVAIVVSGLAAYKLRSNLQQIIKYQSVELYDPTLTIRVNKNNLQESFNIFMCSYIWIMAMLIWFNSSNERAIDNNKEILTETSKINNK
jgi:hypothetical protein